MTTSTFKPGDTFDRYTIEALLGEGGMGRVYAAFDTRLRRKVALKFLALETGTSQEAMVRLLREARAAAALDHPHAVAVHDVGVVDGQPYLVMELIDGRSMRQILQDSSIPWPLRLAWLLDVARALGAAHERGLVHRDVKPENIMVRPDGLVKVLDFGIARMMRTDTLRIVEGGGLRISPGGPGALPILTAAGGGAPTSVSADPSSTIPDGGGPVGTPYYVPPEILRGESIDARADQFSWGVVAYEAITGRLPWETAKDPMMAIAEILSKEPDPPSRFVADLPSLVDATLLKAMAKAPGSRFDSMFEIIAALEPYAAGGSARDPTRRSFTPPPAGAIPPLNDAPTMSAISTGIPTQKDVRPPSPADPEPRAERRRAALFAGVALGAAAAIGGAAIGARLHSGGAATPVDATPPPTATATTIADLPPPSSTVPEAVAAYAAGLRAYRDANLEGLVGSFRRALALDPDLAPALLRLGIFAAWNGQPTVARESFRQATLLRASLSEHDRTVLLAMEPLTSDPPDTPEATRRLAAAVASYPLDAEVWLFYGNILLTGGALDEAIRGLTRAGELDPQWAVPAILLGQARAHQGDFDGALATWSGCAATAATVGACGRNRSRILKQLGRCADVEAEARRMMAMAPSDSVGYATLAQALSSENGATEAVAEALHQSWERLSTSSRPRGELLDSIHFAMLRGDFVTAEHKARDLEALVASEPSIVDHADPTLALVGIQLETGRIPEAVKTATAFLDRRRAWTPSVVHDDETVYRDLTVPMDAVLFHAGRLSATEYENRRRSWLDGWRAQTPPVLMRYAWYQAYAAPATTADDGAAALEALHDYSPLPRLQYHSLPSAETGRVYLLAGRLDEASSWLEKAAAECMALDEPMLHMRANLDLGQVREAKGDAPGACEAYKVVLHRWAAAKPKSVTAELARTRAKALGCKS